MLVPTPKKKPAKRGKAEHCDTKARPTHVGAAKIPRFPGDLIVVNNGGSYEAYQFGVPELSGLEGEWAGLYELKSVRKIIVVTTLEDDQSNV